MLTGYQHPAQRAATPIARPWVLCRPEFMVLRSVSTACSLTFLLLAGMAPVATAAERTWVGDDGIWVDRPARFVDLNWSSSDEPDPNDEAIFDDDVSVTMSGANSVQALTMSGGSDLTINDSGLAVAGLVELSGVGTNLFVSGVNSIVQADAFTVNSGADIHLEGGTLLTIGSPAAGGIDVNIGGEIAGYGLIFLGDQVASPTSVMTLDGELTAQGPPGLRGSPPLPGTLKIIGNGSNSRLNLDGTGGGGDGIVNVSQNAMLDIDVQLSDPFDGTMNLGANSTLDIASPWTFAGAGASQINVNTLSGTAATIAGAAFTQTGGSINVDAGETLQISSSSFTATNGTINNGGHIIFDSAANTGTDSTNISGITFNMMGPTASLTVNPGVRVSITSNDIELDGDGTPTNVVTIGNLGKLDLSLSGAADETFTGHMILDRGTLEVTTSDNEWSLGGTISVVGTGAPASLIDGERVTFSANTAIAAGAALAISAPLVYVGSPTISGNGLLIQNSDATVNGTPSIEVEIFRANAPVTITPGATLLLDVGNIYDPTGSDQYRNTIAINSGRLDVTVADGEWQLGTVGGASGTILFKQSTITPSLGGESTLRVTQGTIDVDGGAVVFVPLILEQTSSNNGTLRFVGDGGLAGLAGHLQLRGGDIHDITDDPSVDTELQLNGGLTVSGTAASGVFVDTFRWDLSSTTIETDAYFAVYADNIEPTGPQEYDDLITINQGTLHVDLGNHASWIMNGYLDLNAGTVGGLNEVTPGGDAIEIGDDDAGTLATLNVGAPGTSTINSYVQFNSDAYVYIESGATLELNGGAHFTPVNGATNGSFGGGAGTWLLHGPVTFAEATTIYMPEGTLGLVDGGKTVAGPVTMTLDNMLSFNGSMSISDPGRLTVNLTDPNDEWTIGSGSTIEYFGDSPSDIFLAGSDINLNGTLNIHGDAQIAARLDIGGTGVINVHPFANLRLSGGSLSDPNTIDDGTVNGPNPLFIGANRALTGHGEISAGVFLDTGAELRADVNFLYVYNGVFGVGGIVGTASDSGRLYLEDAWNTNQINRVDLRGGALSGAEVTNDGVIEGFGTVNVSQLINNSFINANGGTLVLDRFASDSGYDWDGTVGGGTLHAVEGNLTLLSNEMLAPFSGEIAAGVSSGGPLNRTILFQGLGFANSPASNIRLDGGIYRSDTQHTFGGIMETDSALSEIDVLIGSFLNGSTTTLYADLQLRQFTFILSGATFTSDGGTLINLPGATLTIQDGANVADLVLDNQGTLIPGQSPGQITLESYTQSETGVLEIELGGTGANDIDRLIVTGQASLAGTLNLSLIDGFVPSGAETLDFLSAAGGIVGMFDTINLPSLPVGLSWEFDVSDPTMVQLSIIGRPLGDYSGNGLVEQADLDLVLSHWGADATVPPNGWINDLPSGIIDQAELDRVLGNWGRSNAALGAATAAPEPSTMALVAVGLAVAMAVRRSARSRRRFAS